MTMDEHESAVTETVRVVATSLDVSQAYQVLSHADCGGTVLFVGTVREFTRDRHTLHLEYEAYM